MLYDIWTVFWRDWIVLKRRLAKFILSRMVAPLLYLVAFGWGLGRSISVSSGTYLDFLVPGILALNSMNISFNSVIPVHAERIYHKSLEEYLVAPIRPAAFVIGKVLAAVLRRSPGVSRRHRRARLPFRREALSFPALSPRARAKLRDLRGDRLHRGDED